MALHVYPNLAASPSVPKSWTPLKGQVLKYPFRNKEVLRYLRTLLPGSWQK
jgi:hypothetical protein